MNNNIKNLLKVFSSNLFNLVSSVVITFILPVLFEPTDYGYWALYLLYVSYAGFFIFGYCDGIYLKIIGLKYENLNKSKMKFFLKILSLYLLMLFLIFFPSLLIFNVVVTKKYVILCSSIGIILACLNSYFILLNQATQKYNNYAIGNIIEKLVIVLSVILALVFNVKNILFIIVFSLIGKIATLIFYIIRNRDILNATKEKYEYNEVLDNVKIGFSLTISSIFSMLMTGLGKFFVEYKYGIKWLGYYSFVFSLFSPFTQLIDSIALILLPKLKNISKNALCSMVEKTYTIVNYATPIVLLFYLVGKYVVILIFPNYSNSLICFMYLCPMIIIQAKLSIIYNVCFKINRKEKLLLKINFISIIFCFALVLLGTLLFHDYSGIAFMTFISFIIRDIINKIYMKKEFQIKLCLFDFSYICFVLYFAMIIIGVTDLTLFIVILLIFIYSLYKNKSIIKKVFIKEKNYEEK